MIVTVDKNKDGKINYSEFRVGQMMMVMMIMLVMTIFVNGSDYNEEQNNCLLLDHLGHL